MCRSPLEWSDVWGLSALLKAWLIVEPILLPFLGLLLLSRSELQHVLLEALLPLSVAQVGGSVGGLVAICCGDNLWLALLPDFILKLVMLVCVVIALVYINVGVLKRPDEPSLALLVLLLVLVAGILLLGFAIARLRRASEGRSEKSCQIWTMSSKC